MNRVFIIQVTKQYFVLLVLLSVSLACSLGPSINTQPDLEEIMTTLEAPSPPFKLTGRGDKVLDSVSLPSPISKVTFTHNGTGKFIATVYYGGLEKLLVNNVGNYEGTTLIISGVPVDFDIEASGTWTAKIEGVGKATSEVFEGKGDNVSDFFTPLKDIEVWTMNHDGQDNFFVKWHCIGGDSVVAVDEVGNYSGSVNVEFDGDPCWWEVKADGNWSLQTK